MSDRLEVPLFPLGTVLFPGGLLPLRVFEPRYVDMIKLCLRDNMPFGVCLIRDGHETGVPAAPHAVGCLARIEHWDVPHPNLFALLARGGERFRVLNQSVNAAGLIRAEVELLAQPEAAVATDAACEEVLRLAVKRAGEDSVPGPIRFDDPLWVSYRLAEILPITPLERQALLEENDTATRLSRLREHMLTHGIIEKVNKNK